jgi:heme-degrading monooxygenase HmoA
MHGDRQFPFVAVSEIIAPSRAGSSALRLAFEQRLGKVDGREDFGGLEVWQDARGPERFLMVSWWRTKHSMEEYLRSEDHRESHARLPTGELRPRGVRFERFHMVAT